MVWVLTPVDPSLGLSKYYFTSFGSYKIGRKGSAVTIQTDKTVSRVHAELIIEPQNALKLSDASSSRVRLRDVSKFGTFVDKEHNPMPLYSNPDKEAYVKTGSLITVGTNSSTFRLDFLLLCFCVPSGIDSSRRSSIMKAVSALGGYVMNKWSNECTHLVVEDGVHVTKMVFDAVTSRKPIITRGWIEALDILGSPSIEFPSHLRFIPTMTYKLNGGFSSIKIADPEARSKMLQGYTFFLGPTDDYDNKDHLNLLVEISGGITIPLHDWHVHSQVTNRGGIQPKQVLVAPNRSSLPSGLGVADMKLVANMARSNEGKVVAAVLAGQVDPDTLYAPPSPTQSASSDETVEVDDSETDEVPYNQAVTSGLKEGSLVQEVEYVPCSQQDKDMATIDLTGDCKPRLQVDCPTSSFLSTRSEDFEKFGQKFLAVTKNFSPSTTSKGKHERVSTQFEKKDSMASVKAEPVLDYLPEVMNDSKADIIYSNIIVVPESGRFLRPDDRPEFTSGKNFKCFRKIHSMSGNSFAALVPFAKDPYRESEYGQEVKEYMQQEKKRKEAEALAEDLFNAERLKRQRASAAEKVGCYDILSAHQKNRGRGKDKQ